MTSNHNGQGGFLPPSKLTIGDVGNAYQRIDEKREQQYRELPFNFTMNHDGPDLSDLDAIQARKVSELAGAMEKELFESICSSAGIPNTLFNAQATTDKMKVTLEEMARETDNRRIMGIDLNIDQILRSVDPQKLIARTFEVCSYEAIMASVIEKLNRQPTSNAIHRSLEFLMSTTQPIPSDEEYDYEEYQAEMAKLDAKPRHEKEIELLMNELSQLIFVSKARLILNDYPESVSISVQMSPSIQEEETEVAMQAFENVLISMKPKGLIELEVSITNKVVY